MMKEVMIPDIYWGNEFWCIKELVNLGDLEKTLKYADGSIKNIIVDLKQEGNIERIIEDIFNKYKWLDKLLIKDKKGLVGVYKNKRYTDR